MSRTQDGAEFQGQVAPQRRGGFWKVALLLFVPLVLILVAQLIIDENKYITPEEATKIALDEVGLVEAPEDLELTFDEDPDPGIEANAIFRVLSEGADDPASRVDVLIDAETGEVLSERDRVG